jgi:hypothetical protein
LGNQILILEVQIHTVDSRRALPIHILRPDISLAIKCRELWLILYKVVLAILQNSLIIKSSDSDYALPFGFGILVCILHLLLPLFHVAGADGLDL